MCLAVLGNKKSSWEVLPQDASVWSMPITKCSSFHSNTLTSANLYMISIEELYFKVVSKFRNLCGYLPSQLIPQMSSTYTMQIMTYSAYTSALINMLLLSWKVSDNVLSTRRKPSVEYWTWTRQTSLSIISIRAKVNTEVMQSDIVSHEILCFGWNGKKICKYILLFPSRSFVRTNNIFMVYVTKKTKT